MAGRLLAILLILSSTVAAEAAEKPIAVTGFYLTTRYPAMTVRAGEPATIDLTLNNFKQPPQQFVLSVPTVASGWKAAILGGGQPVGAVEVAPDSSETLQLRLEPSKDAQPGDYRFLVEARGPESDLKLPLVITVGKELPAKLKMTTDFPALRGAASTAFKYRFTVVNDSGRKATINFSADAPKDFQVNFTEAYGSQQITSIPIDAGKSKDIEASISLPSRTPAGDYKLAIHAKSAAAAADLTLTLTVTGQPRLDLSGEGGRLSAEAYAGNPSQMTVILRNDGSEAARDVELSATTPEGWKTSFDPKQIAELPAQGVRRIKLTMTPSAQAIAGDYQSTVTASAAGGLDQSANFRITVLTSTLWGAIGVAAIAIALIVVVFAIARFGRR
jgi:uncharacterized membrane protein